MRWPIRNQILVPFTLIQIAAVLLVAVSSAYLAARQVEAEIHARLDNVMTTLETGTYPLTQTVLDQLHQLSGAQFILTDNDGRVRNSTLDAELLTEEKLERLRRDLAQTAKTNRTLAQTQLGEDYLSGVVTPRSPTTLETIYVLYPERRLITARWKAVAPPAILGTVLLCLTVLASYAISRQIAGRIQRVQHHVSRIAGGDFTPMPTVKTNDELRELSQSVNRMADVMDRSMRELKETERTVLLKQLVGGLAHQLRNALTGARISIQLHQQHCSESDDEAIDVALKQLRLTEEQIKALLRLSKGEQSRAQAEELSTILDDAVSLVRPLCNHQKIKLRYQNAAELNCLITDGDALRGALLNILINGIEAAGGQGRLQIDINESPDTVIIDITNSGPPIPTEEHEKVFQPFYTTKPEGVGLGLALARQAVQECGGSLRIVPGDQTFFRMTLPLRRSGEIPVLASPAGAPQKSAVT